MGYMVSSALGWPCCLLGAGRLVRKSKTGGTLQVHPRLVLRSEKPDN